MARRKSLGKKLIATVLSESAFQPDDIGPMKIIADLHDPSYDEMRAIELIHEARVVINSDTDCALVREECQKAYHTKMTQAISLLALARAERLHGATT